MMGHREKMVSGDEYDLLTKWRSVFQPKPGVTRQVKRGFNKRTRKAARLMAVGIAKGLIDG